MELLEALIEDRNEANKIYNKTYERVYEWYMSNFDPHVGNEFPKPIWQHEKEANEIALEKADQAVEKYFKS
jgi:glyoxylate utilization-related uncharacterized protein